MLGTTVTTLFALALSAFAQTTLDLTSTSFTDDPVADPSATDTNAIESITQTSVSASTTTTITEFGPGPVNEPTFPATLTTCFVTSAQATATRTESLDPSASLPPGAECYEFISEGGGLDEIPLLQVGSDGLTTPYGWSTASFPGDTQPTGLSSSSSSGIQSSSSSSKKTGKIVGAVLGSIFGCIIFGGILLWLRRQRRSNSSSNSRRFSRAGNWMRNRPGGWVADEKAPQHFEMQSQQSPSPSAPRPTHF